MAERPQRSWIGGGSIAAICGISPYQSPLDVYLELTSTQEISESQQRFFHRRKALEPFATMCFEHHTGIMVRRVNQRYTSERHPWARAEIDFETMTDWNGETKTVAPEAKHLWNDPETGASPPAYVELQAQWGLDVHPAEGCYVHALIGLDTDWVYEVQANEEAVEIAWKRASDFWQFHVEKRRPPQPTTAEDLLKLYPRDSGRKVEATSAIIDAMDRITRLDNTIALHTADLTKTAFAVKDFMRDATELTQRGKVIATWKARADGVRVFKIR